MKTKEIEEAVNQQRYYQDIRESNKCYCGRFKWPGFSFCRRCIGKLPEPLKIGLFSKIGDGYEEVYEACIEALKTVGVKSYKETGKLS